MKVLNLRCDAHHAFEGWFGSEADYHGQTERGLLSCPVCDSRAITRLPSAPRLNLSGAQAPSGPAATSPAPATASATGQALGPIERVKAAWMAAVEELVSRTEDVGQRFPEEARRIHYGEAEARGIRGQASAEEREALADEGIEVFSLPLPDGPKGSTH